jgi:hypothetical protein
MDFSIKKLAKVLISDPENLPESPGIYFICDAAYRVWYIGKSINLRERHKSHNRLEDFKANKAQWICYLAWNDEEDINDWEQEAIAKYTPVLNYHHKPEELPIIDIGYDKSKMIMRYREIKQMISLFEQELEDLRPNIVTVIEENGGKIEQQNYTASITSRRNWEFSKTVQGMEDHIKKLKKQEQDSGTATVKSVSMFPTIRFK